MTDIGALVSRARNSGLFLDTNVFVVYVLGSLDISLLSKCNRTRSYEAIDYELLRQFCVLATSLRVTPPVITETCNLLGNFNDSRNQAIFRHLRQLLLALKERHASSSELAELPSFARLGLADCSLLSAAREGALVLTDDLMCKVELERENLAVINFNHLRSARLLAGLAEQTQ